MLGSLGNNNLSKIDVSFGPRTGKYSYGNHNDGVNQEKYYDPQKWLKLLKEAAESWSYIYIPQYTVNAHLGAQLHPINYQGGNHILHQGCNNLLSVVPFCQC
eukprot:6632973-Ditylum_brightwellii.AAC.1